jgi:DNA-directed RNA polymerase specialized sigma24 family protein
MDKPDYPEDDEISRALTGSETEIDWAIEQIYLKHGKRLYALAFAVLRSQEDTHEAVQDAILVLYEKAASAAWTLKAPLKSFLNSTVHYKAVDIIRKRMRHKRLGDALEEEQKGVPPVSVDEISSGLSEAEGIANFEKFVASLTPKEKLVAEILGEYWLRCHCVATVKYILERMGETEATKMSVISLRKRVWGKMRMWIEKAEIL